MLRGFYFTTESTEDTEREEAGNAFRIGRIFPVNLVDPAILSKLFAPLLWLWPLGGFAGGSVAGGLGGQAEFAEILLGERGLGIADRFEVLSFDFLVDFPSIDGDGFGRLDTDTHIVTINTLYDQDDVVTDLDRFVDFSGKCKHRSGLSLDAYAVSSIKTWVVE